MAFNKRNNIDVNLQEMGAVFADAFPPEPMMVDRLCAGCLSEVVVYNLLP